MTATSPEVTLYLVRHGESEANAARIFAGQTDSPLTERGRRQAEAVAETLAPIRFDRVVSSDLSRCRDTAEAIARRQGLAVEIFPELREIDVGEAAGRAFDELKGLPAWTDGAFVRWPGGESLEQVLTRVTATIDRIVSASPGRTVCVVGHGGVTRILVSHYLGLLPRLDRSPATNTNITVISTDGLTYRVERLFGADHLDTGT
ncbi:MAG TPA: histidine phosphatase family protein [Candidatus Limnocylindrales bacterium]|nr:histidine phosphatase family protein [Candidatus Limnocylindrales bacterium]